MRESELRTAILISGRGSTAKAVIEACRNGELQRIIPIAVICSRPDIPGKAMAESFGIKTFVRERRNFPSREKFGDALLTILKSLNVDLVSQNGWLPLTPENVVEAYKKNIFNQHPAPLDPGREYDFGGKDMHGAVAVCAWEIYRWLTGDNFPVEATTHFVTPEYDKGDLIRVVKVDVSALPGLVTIAQLEKSEELRQQLIQKTGETQNILLPIEHQNVIETLRLFAEGKGKGFRRPESLIPSSNEIYVKQAKNLARQLFPKG